MATFVVLATFSEQGIKNVRQTIERADAFKHMAKKAGVTVKDIYWTLGSRDSSLSAMHLTTRQLRCLL